MKNLDLYITAIMLAIGLAIFTVAMFSHNETWTDIGVVLSVVSFVPCLVSSALGK